MQKYIAELIGAFFLVLTIGLAVAHAGDLAPLAIGLGLMVMVYAGGHISGAHYNPAVTLGVWMRGKCETRDVPGYMIAQVVGAAAAAGAVMFLRTGDPPAPMQIDVLPALVAEVLFTFALVYVILNVATARATEGNSYFGLAIGMTVTAGAYSVGAISGGAFNPAVAIGIVVMGFVNAADIWIFLVANFGAAALAALAFKALHPDE